MKKYFLAQLIIFVLGLAISAQTLEKPTLESSKLTPAQEKILREGVALHDGRAYDEAIAKYKEILEQNKDSADAIYELALTYYTKKDLDNAAKVALIGSKYKSNHLSLFYGIIANVLDDKGEPQKAIKLYQDAINIVNADAAYKSYTSSLYYNLGITYIRIKDYKQAREALKTSVEQNFGYASPNYYLAVVFNETGYKVPAFLAACRFLSLELNSQRSNGAVEIVRKFLKGNVEKGDGSDSLKIIINQDAPTDEGDFSSLELISGLSKIGAGISDENKNKSEEELFAAQMETFIDSLLKPADKKLNSKFVGKTYIPFFAAMKKSGHLETFSYLVLQQSGNQKAYEWLNNNKQKFSSLMEWSKNFTP